MQDDRSIFMRRCLELASNGAGNVSPNPLVGAVLVHENKIIGEGWHQKIGEAHAEVNAIDMAVKNGFSNVLSRSELFVSLEPCSHYGKTPPCTELIIKHNIQKVTIGCRDPFPEVNGKGIKYLQEAGVTVEENLLSDECKIMNRRFITFHTKKRPFIILKFAQSGDHYLAPLPGKSGKISNDYSDKLVHRWRSEEDAILVGTKTAALDNPRLTVRNWTGRNPVRLTIDRLLKLPVDLHLFDTSAPTLIFNNIKDEQSGSVEFIKINFDENVLNQILNKLYSRNIQSLIVEGGKNVLQQFIDQSLWDEARIITAEKKFGDGIKSPDIPGRVISSDNIHGDVITILKPIFAD